MYKYCSVDGLESMVPANEERTYGIVEKILDQNEMILRAMLFNPLVERNAPPLNGTENTPNKEDGELHQIDAMDAPGVDWPTPVGLLAYASRSIKECTKRCHTGEIFNSYDYDEIYSTLEITVKRIEELKLEMKRVAGIQ